MNWNGNASGSCATGKAATNFCNGNDAIFDEQRLIRDTTELRSMRRWLVDELEDAESTFGITILYADPFVLVGHFLLL